MYIANPKDIAYLAFEGGGGKGVTYVGALKALEGLGVLPINVETPGKNQIKGISGGSAGAIIALLVAMGVKSDDLEKILTKSETFNGFFDPPRCREFRMVDRYNEPGKRKESGPPSSLWSSDQTIVVYNLLCLVFEYLHKRKANTVTRRLGDASKGYAYNFLFDRGLFPGFAMRMFLSSMISERLKSKIANFSGSRPISGLTGANLNFEQFYGMTGVDLVVTGSNLTKHRPGVFSRYHTPAFPVAEAVGISSSYPVFKPVYVEAYVPTGPLNARADDYHGFWCDAGLTNNFPLHAFDLWPPLPARNPNPKPLAPGMLGLRLTEGSGPPLKSGSKAGPWTPLPSPKQPRNPDYAHVLSAVLEHVGDMLGTMLYSGEQGQIRSAEEQEQTIDLYTYELETLEFASSLEKRTKPIEEAANAVRSYFEAKK